MRKLERDREKGRGGERGREGKSLWLEREGEREERQRATEGEI